MKHHGEIKEYKILAAEDRAQEKSQIQGPVPPHPPTTTAPLTHLLLKPLQKSGVTKLSVWHE